MKDFYATPHFWRLSLAPKENFLKFIWLVLFKYFSPEIFCFIEMLGRQFTAPAMLKFIATFFIIVLQAGKKKHIKYPSLRRQTDIYKSKPNFFAFFKERQVPDDFQNA